MPIYPFSPLDHRYPIKAYIDDMASTGPVGEFGIPLVVEETPFPRGQVAFPYGVNQTQIASSTSNGGTVTQADGKGILQTSANAAGVASIRSRYASRYTPGQGRVVKFSAVFTAGLTGSQQEAGVGDGNDGFFFGYVGTEFGIIARRSGIDTFIPQSAWNGTFNGQSSVPAGFDPTLLTYYQIRYRVWGATNFYIEDPVTGYGFLVHTFQGSGVTLGPQALNPTLPAWARVFNAGNASNVTLKIGAMGLLVEGRFNDTGARFGFYNRKTAIGATETNIFTIRNNLLVFGGQVNRSAIRIDFIASALAGNAESLVRILLNATVTGASFADLDATNSIVAIDTTGGAVTAFERQGPPIPSTGNQQQFADISGIQMRINPGETLTFSCLSFAANVNCTVGASWREEL